MKMKMNKNKKVRANVDRKLREQYHKRTFSVRNGDSVEILRGIFKGQSGKVSEVKDGKLIIEGITIKKTDGTAVPFPIEPSNVKITKLEMNDSWRREKLGGEQIAR
jgi:large subunit ribosomal protein L24